MVDLQRQFQLEHVSHTASAPFWDAQILYTSSLLRRAFSMWNLPTITSLSYLSQPQNMLGDWGWIFWYNVHQFSLICLDLRSKWPRHVRFCSLRLDFSNTYPRGSEKKPPYGFLWHHLRISPGFNARAQNSKALVDILWLCATSWNVVLQLAHTNIWSIQYIETLSKIHHVTSERKLWWFHHDSLCFNTLYIYITCTCYSLSMFLFIVDTVVDTTFFPTTSWLCNAILPSRSSTSENQTKP